MLNTWGLGVSTFGFVAVGRREASMNRTNVGFSASWYLTDSAYCEDIKKRLATLYPLVMDTHCPGRCDFDSKRAGSTEC